MIKTIYEASDGTQFSDIEKATIYEKQLETKVYKKYTVVASFRATKLFQITAEDDTEVEWLLKKDWADDWKYLEDIEGVNDIEEVIYNFTNDEGKEVYVGV